MLRGYAADGGYPPNPRITTWHGRRAMASPALTNDYLSIHHVAGIWLPGVAGAHGPTTP